MALECHERRALPSELLRVLPDLDRPFGIGRGQFRAVAGEGYRPDGRRVSGLILRDQAACGCVENVQISLHDMADSEPLAIRTQRRPNQRAIETSIPGQRSHLLRSFIQAEDREFCVMEAVADDRQRQTIGRQSQTASGAAMRLAAEFPIDGCDHLALHGAQPPNLVVDDDQPGAVRGEDETAERIIGGVNLASLIARGGVKYAHLAGFSQRGQPSVGRQDAELSAGAAGQVPAARLNFDLRAQLPTPHLAVLIQRHELIIQGENTADDGDLMSRENRGTVIRKMLVVVPLKAAQVGLGGSGVAIGNVSRQEDAQLLSRRSIVSPQKRGQLHIGRILKLAAGFLFGSSQPLGGQGPCFLGFHNLEGFFRILARFLGFLRVMLGLSLIRVRVCLSLHGASHLPEASARIPPATPAR